MDEPRGMAIARALMAKGVEIPNPWSVDLDPALDPDLISGDGVVIHNGCRIRGATTTIGAGSVIGREGPVTLESCQLGEGVQIKGGYASKAVFLDGANLGLGCHVREGCLLEEEANGAHTVGLKQTILFPFVTLGSLINFCDVLMTGGTSRSDHSEVGSSYIHFNFTPAGDKTTASLYGDVPRGVMLRERPIFLGGQGGSVGPVRVAFGTVVGAGSVLRTDVMDENLLVLPPAPGDVSRPHRPESYKRLPQIVVANLGYLAQLDALDAWYREVRAPFFARQPLGGPVLEGALRALASARTERIGRLTKMAPKLDETNPAHAPYRAQMTALTSGFGGETAPAPAGLLSHLGTTGGSYVDEVRDLPADLVAAGTAWLQSIVDSRMAAARALVPDLPA